MKLNIDIKNLGKIDKGKVSLDRLTLFCGPNNTGKTYVSKVLYSVLRVVNSNHSRNLITADSLSNLYSFLHYIRREKEEAPVMRKIAELASIPPQYLDIVARDDGGYARRVREIAKKPSELNALLPRRRSSKNPKEGEDFLAATEESIRETVSSIKKFAKMSQENIFKTSIENTIPKLLRANFMTNKISDLATSGAQGFSFDIQGVMKIATSGSKASFDYKNIASISKMPLVLYLNGLGLKAARGRRMSGLGLDGFMVGGFPYYHNDFLETLDLQLPPSDDLQGLLDEVTRTIGGKLEYSDGEIYFQEKEKARIKISLASSGIRQIGAIGLLLERGLLIKNSTIFIDEPETNLHPLWQGALAQVLAKLALEEINVVIATHSPFIVQHVKYAAKKDRKLDKIMAVNHYSQRLGINEELKSLKGNHERLEFIEKELNEIYMRTLLRDINDA